ncbi:MAG: hypothetical protein H0T84_13310 [Tatlockia sp.]|nr:hypothetical protein [Tatlockia sp.]
METSISHLIHKISEQKYEQFGSLLKNNMTDNFNLHSFKNELICDYIKQFAKEIFAEEIHSMIGLLNKIEVGIAVVDVPQTTLFDESENTVIGAAVVMGIFNHIGIANLDPINQLPFMVHTASHSNERKIDSKGLQKPSPELKLGFHNDGLLSTNKIEIPECIMVYNFYISYRKPGNFMWIPTVLWEEGEKYEALAKEKDVRVKIKLNPNYHFDEKGDIVNTIFDYVEAPISKVSKFGERRFFLNGQVLLEDNLQEHVDFVQSIRDSLEKNTQKICIPQCERRAFYIKNTLGFHARNIFEEPIEGVDLTRVYLRAVDTNAELYSSI